MNYFYLLFPIILVYVVSLIYPVSQNAGKQVSFRPPPYVFAIVWPILLLLVGYSWTLRPDMYIIYFILTFSIAIWSIIFNYSTLGAFYQIVFTTLFTIFVYFYNYNALSSNLLIPLELWLCFASVLNYYSI